MPAIRRILFAVREPHAADQPGITKAIRIARSFGASLELFHAQSAPLVRTFETSSDRTLAGLCAEAAELTRKRLARFIPAARRQGVALDCAVEWDYPPHEAIVRRAARIRADLIVAECHRGRRTLPWLMHLTDWELLRTSAIPVLLLKNAAAWRRPVVLAAVDPTHEHAKPARLDADILAAAAQFSVALHGSQHVLFANHPAVDMLALGDPSIGGSALAMTRETLERQGREIFERFMAAMDLSPARCHIVMQPPVQAIPAVARSTNAGLVVMGAVSRSGLERVFIGNTAERVLDALPCDVLVLKPRGTKSAVPAVKRGVRLVNPPATPLVA